MRTDNYRWLYPAMQVIRRVDPDLHDRIAASDTDIAVISDGSEDSLWEFGEKMGFGNYATLVNNLGRAYGVTPGNPVTGRGEGIFLSRPLIEKWAAENGVSVAEFAAAIIVHEFVHQEGVFSEPPAYDAEIKFAAKLGSPRLVSLARQVKSEVGSHA